MSDHADANLQGDPGADTEADTASGGAPEDPQTPESTYTGETDASGAGDESTDDGGQPVDNPSGG
ncbi:hypothetical protein ABC304_08945 [Microbacterium sp. 1P10UB]|uniref:hypothetical protein n=1 Tax=unclassified Microbacterium TaxID=2609290 RepID=UPI0039A3400D